MVLPEKTAAVATAPVRASTTTTTAAAAAKYEVFSLFRYIVCMLTIGLTLTALKDRLVL
jgi:hypothetical protein